MIWRGECTLIVHWWLRAGAGAQYSGDCGSVWVAGLVIVAGGSVTVTLYNIILLVNLSYCININNEQQPHLLKKLLFFV